MNRARLSHLESILRREAKTPTVRFDLVFFYERTSCGTAACALGLAATDPHFNSEGFTLNGCEFPITRGALGFDAVGFDAAEIFFDLSSSEARHLFSSYNYPDDQRESPLVVADRIHTLLESAQ